MELIEEQVERFFGTARERYEIFRRTWFLQKLQPEAWKQYLTEDKVFQKWWFPNVFREDDDVTIWIKNNIRKPLAESPSVLWAMVACRLFNNIVTLRKLKKAGLFDEPVWNCRKAIDVLEGQPMPLIGPAYMVRSLNGADKLTGICEMVKAGSDDTGRLVSRMAPETRTMQQMCYVLKQFPCLGNFLAYEMTQDLRHTYLLRYAKDVRFWAPVTRGTAIGFDSLVKERVSFTTKSHHHRILEGMQKLLLLSRHEQLWSKAWPKWEMQEVQRWLGRYAKYCKVDPGGGTLKRGYHGETEK